MNVALPPLILPSAYAPRPVPQPVQVQPAPVQVEVKAPVRSTPHDRNAVYEAAVRVSQAASEQTYVVSDQKFAIFKDASGKLITRYVSLRDGSVTYEPAPSYVKSALPPIQFHA